MPESFFTIKLQARHFAKFIGKHLCQSLFFDKVAGFRPETLLKKILWRRCFLVKFAKFLENLFYRTPLKMFDSSKNRYVEEQKVTG